MKSANIVVSRRAGLAGWVGAWIVLVLAAPVIALAGQSAPLAPDRVDLPAQFEAGRAFVTVKITANGKSVDAQLLVDTGANVTLINPEVLDKAGMSTADWEAPKESEPGAGARHGRVAEIACGSMRQPDFDLHIATNSKVLPKDGRLGTDFLKFYSVLFQPSMGTVVLSREGSNYEPWTVVVYQDHADKDAAKNPAEYWAKIDDRLAAQLKEKGISEVTIGDETQDPTLRRTLFTQLLLSMDLLTRVDKAEEEFWPCQWSFEFTGPAFASLTFPKYNLTVPSDRLRIAAKPGSSQVFNGGITQTWRIDLDRAPMLAGDALDQEMIPNFDPARSTASSPALRIPIQSRPGAEVLNRVQIRKLLLKVDQGKKTQLLKLFETAKGEEVTFGKASEPILMLPASVALREAGRGLALYHTATEDAPQYFIATEDTTVSDKREIELLPGAKWKSMAKISRTLWDAAGQAPPTDSQNASYYLVPLNPQETTANGIVLSRTTKGITVTLYIYNGKQNYKLKDVTSQLKPEWINEKYQEAQKQAEK